MQYLNSASVLIEDKGVKLLCDPWLVDGEYYGSWALYPPSDFTPAEFNDVDFIYITHIHPDHFSVKTLSKISKSIPVIIYNFTSKFLKNNLERLGFTVRELDHNKRTHLKGNLYLNILAADNCNPALCSKFLGCGNIETKFMAEQIDTLAAIDNGQQVVVNTNDCPFELSYSAATAVKQSHDHIDMLLVGYSGAGPYPQCFKMTDEERRLAAKKKEQQFLLQATNYINLLKPRYYMPFAGRYTLAGKLADLDAYRGVPELEDAKAYFDASADIDVNKHECVILNSRAYFDLSTGQSSIPYKLIDKEKKAEYIERVLRERKLDYELEPHPKFDDIIALIDRCVQHFERKRKEIAFISDTVILLDTPQDKVIAIPCDGSAYQILSKSQAARLDKYVKMTVDDRLLKWLLQGPRLAHWNNAEIGSHVIYERKPDVYERGLHYCMCYFHM